MRYFRPIIYTIFVCSCLLFGWMLYQQCETGTQNTAMNAPEITSSVEVLKLKVKEKDNVEKLLEGLTASDEEDGDLTGEIMLSEVSGFEKSGECTASYCVSDLDGNTTFFSRKIQYTDYSSTLFTIEKEPVCYVGEEPNIREFVSVSDSLDGDLTEKMTIDTSKLDTEEDGLYPVTLTVANSLGDEVSYRMFMCVKKETENQAAVKLTQYSVVLDKGEEFDPEDYVDSVLNEQGEAMIDPELDITNESTGEEGVFPVIYQLKDYYADTTAVLMVEIR